MVSVTLVNINQVQLPAIYPYAIDILGTALEDSGHDVTVLDLNQSDEPLKSIDDFFKANDPDLIGITMRNSISDVYLPSFFDLESHGGFLSSHQSLIEKIKQHIDSKKIIVGGAGFSIAPAEILKRMGLKYGVKGLGERKIVEIANQVNVSGRISGEKFKIFDGTKDQPLNKVKRGFVDLNWYYQRSGQLNIRGQVGCLRQCSYCIDHLIKGRRAVQREINDIIMELEQLVENGIKHIHFTDAEVNLNLPYSKNLLRLIANSGLPKAGLNLYGHFQLKPFDEEYAKLLSNAGFVGVNFSTDHTDEYVLRIMNKNHTRENVTRITSYCQDYGIKVMHELLFGYPGDNKEKMKSAIDFMTDLDPYVTGICIGIGVLPGTKLHTYCQREQNGLYTSGEPFLDPTFFVDPSFGNGYEELSRTFDDLQKYVGSDSYKFMVPTMVSTARQNNQTAGSDRIKEQIKQGKFGAGWFHYREFN